MHAMCMVNLHTRSVCHVDARVYASLCVWMGVWMGGWMGGTQYAIGPSMPFRCVCMYVHCCVCTF